MKDWYEGVFDFWEPKRLEIEKLLRVLGLVKDKVRGHPLFSQKKLREPAVLKIKALRILVRKLLPFCTNHPPLREEVLIVLGTDFTDTYIQHLLLFPP